jgi:hypothetical protein
VDDERSVHTCDCIMLPSGAPLPVPGNGGSATRKQDAFRLHICMVSGSCAGHRDPATDFCGPLMAERQDPPPPAKLKLLLLTHALSLSSTSSRGGLPILVRASASVSASYSCCCSDRGRTAYCRIDFRAPLSSVATSATGSS